MAWACAGDLMKSLTLLEYSSSEASMEARLACQPPCSHACPARAATYAVCDMPQPPACFQLSRQPRQQDWHSPAGARTEDPPVGAAGVSRKPPDAVPCLALQVRAKDYNNNWMSAAAMLDRDTFLGAENSHNLFVCAKNTDDARDEARASLEVRQQQLLSCEPSLAAVPGTPICSLRGRRAAWAPRDLLAEPQQGAPVHAPCGTQAWAEDARSPRGRSHTQHALRSSRAMHRQA